MKRFVEGVDLDNWTGIRVHEIAHRVSKAIGDRRHDGKVATLSPLYAIEAGLKIYDELSTGPFTYLSGDLLTAEQRKKYKITSPNSISKMFEDDPPIAIFVGFESFDYVRKSMDMESPLVAYAEQKGFERVHGDFGGRTLYVNRRRP